MDRNEIQENLCKLVDSENLERDIAQSQKQFYNVQLEIFSLILDVISEKEKLLQHQRRMVNRDNNQNQNGGRGFGTTAALDSLPELGSVKIDGTEEDDEDEEFCDCEENRDGSKKGENESESEEDDEFFDSQSHMSESEERNENNFIQFPNNNNNKTDNNNKWMKSRKLYLEETEEMKKKKELVNAINRLYRKRAVVRNKQVSILTSYMKFQVVLLSEIIHLFIIKKIIYFLTSVELNNVDGHFINNAI